jgi:hypothetical protein
MRGKKAGKKKVWIMWMEKKEWEVWNGGREKEG